MGKWWRNTRRAKQSRKWARKMSVKPTGLLNREPESSLSILKEMKIFCFQKRKQSDVKAKF
jgi:hypothetical protein